MKRRKTKLKADRLHLIYIPFTGVGLNNGFKSQEWYQDRIQVFLNYTLKSLKNQINPDFILWLSFRPEERDNPLTKKLSQRLDEEGLSFVMTFNGLMYWDDKYSDKLGDRLKVLKKYSRPGRRMEMLRNLWFNKNADLEQRIEKSLRQFPDGLTKFKWVYLTRLDSDDMLKKNFTYHVIKQEPFPGAIVVKKGYIYNKEQDQFAEWNPPTNPPFHTIIFPQEVFWNPYFHKQWYEDFKSHEDITRIFETKQLKDGMYLVFTHDPTKHISTTWDHPFRGPVITDESLIAELKRDFGI